MNPRLVRLPGGDVLRFREDPAASYFDAAGMTVVNDGPEAASGPPSPASVDSKTRSFTEVLRGKSVLVIGAGAVGSHVAYGLAAYSLVIHLVDKDTVDYKHTRAARTIYEPVQVHKKKVYAARYKIERDFPGSKVLPYHCDVNDVPGDAPRG